MTSRSGKSFIEDKTCHDRLVTVMTSFPTLLLSLYMFRSRCRIHARGFFTLGYAHQGKVKNIRMAALKKNQMNVDSRISIPT